MTEIKDPEGADARSPEAEEPWRTLRATARQVLDCLRDGLFPEAEREARAFLVLLAGAPVLVAGAELVAESRGAKAAVEMAILGVRELDGCVDDTDRCELADRLSDWLDRHLGTHAQRPPGSPSVPAQPQDELKQEIARLTALLAQREPLPERDPGTCRVYRHGAPDLAHWKRDDCVDWVAVPCPHARPTWRMCPHCLGVGAASEQPRAAPSTALPRDEAQPPELGRCVELDHDCLHEQMPSCDQWMAMEPALPREAPEPGGAERLLRESQQPHDRVEGFPGGHIYSIECRRCGWDDRVRAFLASPDGASDKPRVAPSDSAPATPGLPSAGSPLATKRVWRALQEARDEWGEAPSIDAHTDNALAGILDLVGDLLSGLETLDDRTRMIASRLHAEPATHCRYDDLAGVAPSCPESPAVAAEDTQKNTLRAGDTPATPNRGDT